MIRRRVVLRCLVVVIGFTALSTPSTSYEAQTPAPAMLHAAQAFLGTLSPVELAQTTMPFDTDERYNWFYTPVDRKGLPFKLMDAVQQEAAIDLLRAGFSEKGYDKAQAIRQLEMVLFEMSGQAFRDTELYYFTIFGEPSARGPWGWRYEGHHISQHWTLVNGNAMAASPQFFGANPAEVRQGSMRGTRVLSNEEDLARMFLLSLNESQRAEAIVSPTAPDDILTTNKREATVQTDEGVAFGTLTGDQQRKLMDVIEEYTNAQPTQVAQDRLERLHAQRMEQIKFAWMGKIEKGERHYYRIQGPSFLIEYDNTQDDANHIHSVWRDFNGDFGQDLLAAHYRKFSHHANVEP
jgi:hypothetical protein